VDDSRERRGDTGVESDVYECLFRFVLFIVAVYLNVFGIIVVVVALLFL